MAQMSSALLSLPPEIRNKIWAFAFTNTEAIPLRSSLLRRRDTGGNGGGAAYDSSCHGCSHKSADADPQTLTVADSVLPLLTCHQIHAEAVALYQSTLHVHVCLTSELQLRGSDAARSCAQSRLRHLSIQIHLGISRDADIQEDMRHLWIERLSDLPERFPSLETLHITAHLRPPIGYDNLVDAIIVGPLCVLPSRIKLSMDFDYVAEDVMIDHPALGRVWYSDALHEHTKVIEDCLADETFREGFEDRRNLNVMTARLLQISQEHEQPWLLSLRMKKIQRDREEARMNARANGAR